MSDLTMLVTPLRAGLRAEGRTMVDLLVQVQVQVQGLPTPAGIKTERPPLNLALVLDRPGSMGGRPLTEASHTRSWNEETAEEKVDRYLRRKTRQVKEDECSGLSGESPNQQSGA